MEHHERAQKHAAGRAAQPPRQRHRGLRDGQPAERRDREQVAALDDVEPILYSDQCTPIHSGKNAAAKKIPSGQIRASVARRPLRSARSPVNPAPSASTAVIAKNSLYTQREKKIVTQPNAAQPVPNQML